MAQTDERSLTDIVAEMRRLGVTRLKTPSIEVDLGPDPGPAPTPKAKQDEDETALSDEQKAEQQWDRFWSKATRSSGVQPPPFPRKRLTVPQ